MDRMSDQKKNNREPGMSTKQTLHDNDENRESSKSAKESTQKDDMMKEFEGHREDRRRSSPQQDFHEMDYERNREERRSSLESAFVWYQYLLTK